MTTEFPLKAIKALCQMVLNPVHYITNSVENQELISRLLKARAIGLKETEKEFKNDPFLRRYKEQAFFSDPPPKKQTVKLGSRNEPLYEEKLAMELAFWMIVQYKLSIYTFLPRPVDPDKEIGVWNDRFLQTQDYLFEGGFVDGGWELRKWDEPGPELDLEGVLSRFRHRL